MSDGLEIIRMCPIWLSIIGMTLVGVAEAIFQKGPRQEEQQHVCEHPDCEGSKR